MFQVCSDVMPKMAKNVLKGEEYQCSNEQHEELKLKCPNL